MEPKDPKSAAEAAVRAAFREADLAKLCFGCRLGQVVFQLQWQLNGYFAQVLMLISL